MSRSRVPDRFLAVVLIATLAGAALIAAHAARAGDEALYGPAAPPGSAFVRVFNGTPQSLLDARVGTEDFNEIPPYDASEFTFLPPGSYSLSAGGPIISPAVRSLIVTPICPHTLTHRPLLVPDNVEIEVTLTSKDEGAMATLDGQVGVALTQGDTVVLKVSEHRTLLIRFPESSYYAVLREKLKWGDG